MLASSLARCNQKKVYYIFWMNGLYARVTRIVARRTYILLTRMSRSETLSLRTEFYDGSTAE